MDQSQRIVNIKNSLRTTQVRTKSIFQNRNIFQSWSELSNTATPQKLQVVKSSIRHSLDPIRRLVIVKNGQKEDN